MGCDFKKETLLSHSLIDAGCNIVFGSGAHHIVEKPYIFYNNGLIIYGLGDLSGDFIYKHSFNSDDSLSLIYNTKDNTVDKINLTKQFNSDGCGIPIKK
ncbi:MAG: hypothetical protein CXT73_07485 [Methanobacteriota archaeon]|nr:MAG: hypothetical protein CXT73_07485 [Euryarchaeota archaeon]